MIKSTYEFGALSEIPRFEVFTFFNPRAKIKIFFLDQPCRYRGGWGNHGRGEFWTVRGKLWTRMKKSMNFNNFNIKMNIA